MAVANVCLIRVWTDLLAYPVWPAHRDYDPPQLTHYAAAITLTLLLGSLLWFVLQRSKSFWWPVALGTSVFLLICKETFLAISGLGAVQRASFLTPLPISFTVAGLALAAGFFYRNPRQLHNLGTKLAAALVPLTLLTFVQSAWQATRIPPLAVRRVEAARTAARPARRVVWLILDELDERVAFTQRRPGTRLPELDRFRREAALVALNARSPENATLVALPRLLAFSLDPADATGSVIARAKRAGFRTAIVGWALPYCRIFESWADSCAWWPMPQQHNSFRPGLAGTILSFGISLFETNQLSPFGQSESVARFARTVEEMTVAAAEVAARPDLDFVFLHLPPPHNPYAFNPKTGKIDRAIVRFPNPAGYFDNLLLADQVFGRIRRAMEQAGVWDNSLVLVTADHGLRSGVPIGYGPEDRHVPFMVKSRPGPELSIEPEAPLATERTGDLLLKWLADHKS